MATIPDFFKGLVVKKQPKTGTAITPTHNPQNASQILTAPTYREHQASLYDDRLSKTSRALLQDLFKNDPDVSAAVGSYLTLSDTPMIVLVRDAQGQIDRPATEQVMQLITALTRPTDYSQGFTLKPSLEILKQEFRYMALLRGAIATELVFNKMLVPERLQQVDIDSIEWFEKSPGVYKPRQKVPGKSDGVMLDIPSFFVAFHRRDPTKIYPTSDFVSVINTSAARQQVVNDLYRIMQVTGFPRISIEVLEEVVIKNAPASVRESPDELKTWVNSRIQEVADSFSDLRADQAFAHSDAVKPTVINDKNPGAGLDIKQVIDVLNAQNQAALKTMATILGRGSGSTQVAAAEVRIAAMNADQLNVPLAHLLEQAFTFLLNSYGTPGFVEVKFQPAELRPDLELEPQRVLRQSRLLQDLSLGNITDEEYHLWSYGRLPPVGAPILSGTGFLDANETAVDASETSPNANGGSLGNSIAPGQKKATDLNKSKSIKAGLNLTLNIQ